MQAADEEADRRYAAALHDNLQESLLAEANELPGHRRTPATELAPRVVPQPPVLLRPPLLLALLFAPFRFGYSAVGAALRFVLYVFSFLPNPLRPRGGSPTIRRGWRGTSERRVTVPKETAERFRREFEEEYGPHDLVFFDGGQAQALDTAKRELKFLLVVLISPEHDDTSTFVRETLLAPEVVAFVNNPANNIIVWGGNVLEPEAYQVASDYMCTKFPASCLISLTPKEGSTRMGIVKRLAGPMTPGAYLSGLEGAMAKYRPDIESLRAERAAQAVARNLRSEQDSAYERSLAMDRERARRKREEEANARAAEERAREKAEAEARQEELRTQWRRWRATTIAPEPTDGVRLALNMPPSAGGGRVVRKFASDAPLDELYAFVECYGLLQVPKLVKEGESEKPDDYEHKYAFRIASVMPRETLEPSMSVTIGGKMGRGGNLIVEETGYDEDDDHE